MQIYVYMHCTHTYIVLYAHACIIVYNVYVYSLYVFSYVYNCIAVSTRMSQCIFVCMRGNVLYNVW